MDAHFLAVHAGLATPRFVRRAHAAGKDVYVWTVNDPVNMFWMISRGVDGVITDEPALGRTVLTRRADMTAIERLLLEAAFWLGAVPDEPPPESDVRIMAPTRSGPSCYKTCAKKNSLSS